MWYCVHYYVKYYTTLLYKVLHIAWYVDKLGECNNLYIQLIQMIDDLVGNNISYANIPLYTVYW